MSDESYEMIQPKETILTKAVEGALKKALQLERTLGQKVGAALARKPKDSDLTQPILQTPEEHMAQMTVEAELTSPKAQIYNPFACTIWSMSSFCIFVGWYAYLFIFKPHLCFLSMIPFLPTIPIAIWWWYNKEHSPIHEVIVCFSDGVGTCASAMVLQNLILYSYFGEANMRFNPNIFKDPKNLFFVIMVVVLSEEILKVYVFHFNKVQRAYQHVQRNLVVSTLISTGFYFAESISMIFVIYSYELQSGLELYLYTVISMIYGTPLNIISGYLSGLIWSQKDKSVFHPLLITVPLRVTYMFWELLFLFNVNSKMAVIASISSTCVIVTYHQYIVALAQANPETAEKNLLEMLDPTNYVALPGSPHMVFKNENLA